MSDEQLQSHAQGDGRKLFRLRIQAQTERLDAPSELRKQRRPIARIKTIHTSETRSGREDDRLAAQAEAVDSQPASPVKIGPER